VRRQSLVAGAVLTAALVTLVALPGVAGSQTPSPVRPITAEAFQAVRLPASDDGSQQADRPLEVGYESAGHLDATAPLIDRGDNAPPGERPVVLQPAPEREVAFDEAAVAERAAATEAAEARATAAVLVAEKAAAAKAAAKAAAAKAAAAKAAAARAAAARAATARAAAVRAAARATAVRAAAARAAAARRAVSHPPSSGYRRVVSGIASWYDNGTTAMRLPRGTRIKICGARTCINTVVRDWGPAGYLSNRVVDMTPGDFTRVTGRRLSAGLAPVRVYIY
jgi:hypothetical protein